LCSTGTQLPPSKKGGGAPPQFSAHVYCGQTAAWIKMPLGAEVGLGPDDIVLDRDSAPPSPKRGQSPLPNFRPMSIVAKVLDGSSWHLAWRWALVQATLCWMGIELPSPKKGQSPQFLAHVYCAQTAGWIKTPLGTEVDLGPGHFALDGFPAIGERGTAAPLFSTHAYCGHGRPSQLLLRSCYGHAVNEMDEIWQQMLYTGVFRKIRNSAG